MKSEKEKILIRILYRITNAIAPHIGYYETEEILNLIEEYNTQEIETPLIGEGLDVDMF